MSANVIKPRVAAVSLHVPSIKKDVHDAALEARQIVADAEAKAAQIVADAQREKEAVLAEASQKGYAEGLDKWNDALVEAWAARDQFLARNESEVVKLAIAVAEKIIGRVVGSDPSAVLQIVREAMKCVHREKKVTLRVNPEDAAALPEKTELVRTLLEGMGELIVVSNPSVSRGGCIVETDLGVVDAQIPTQLASLEKALLRRSGYDSR